MRLITKFNSINFIFCLIGFPLVTTLIESDSVSVVYRAIALMVAIVCIFLNRKNKISYPSLLKIYLIFLLIFTAKVVYHLYLGTHAGTPYVASRNMAMLFAFGIVWIPLWAIVTGHNYIVEKKSLILVLLALVYVIGRGYLNAYNIDSTNDGRFQLNARQSTLAFGDNSAMLIILSSVLLFKVKSIFPKKIKLLKIFIVCSLILGIMGLLKAGSRGPVVSCLGALFFIFVVQKLRAKLAIISGFCLLSVLGVASLSTLENFAPVLYQRMALTIEHNDSSGRDVLFEEAWDTIVEDPILGGNPILLGSSGFSSYHNVYLGVGVGLGLFAMILFIGIVLYMLYQSIRKSKQVDSAMAMFVISMFWFFAIRGITGVYILSNATYNVIFVLSCFYLSRKYLSLSKCR